MRKADYALVDALLIQHAKREQPDKCEEFLAFGTDPPTINPIHLGLSKSLSNAAKIIEQFNQTIRLMQADETYNPELRLNSIAIDIDDNGEKELVLNGIELATISSGYENYSNDKKLPPKTRYSIRDQTYNGWD